MSGMDIITIRMQHGRVVPAALSQQSAFNQLFRQLSRLRFMDFPGNDLAAVNVHDQVEVPVLTTHR